LCEVIKKINQESTAKFKTLKPMASSTELEKSRGLLATISPYTLIEMNPGMKNVRNKIILSGSQISIFHPLNACVTGGMALAGPVNAVVISSPYYTSK
jgi:hypothetical protein